MSSYCGHAAGEHSVEFVVKAGFGDGILAKQKPGPCQRVGHGFKASKEKREHLVAEFFVVQLQTVAFLVARQQQHGEQIPALRETGDFASAGLAAVSSNHAIHCCIQPRFGAAEAAHLRQRRIEQEFGARHGDEVVVEIHDRR